MAFELDSHPRVSIDRAFIRKARSFKRSEQAFESSRAGRNPAGFKAQVQDWVIQQVREHGPLINKLHSESVLRLRSRKKAALINTLIAFEDAACRWAILYARGHNIPTDEFKVIDLERLCMQFAFEFIQSLKASARAGETYNNALMIASNMHRLNPLDMQRLRRKYLGKVNESVIKYAALFFYRDPEGYIDAYIPRQEYLVKRYSNEVDMFVINHMALNYPNTCDEQITVYQERLSDLLDQNPAMRISVAKQMALVGSKKELTKKQREAA